LAKFAGWGATPMFGFRKHNDASEKSDERNPYLMQVLFRLIDHASRNTGVSKDEFKKAMIPKFNATYLKYWNEIKGRDADLGQKLSD
jgi:hypothetical protein